MINRRIVTMTLFSLGVHMAVAAVIVYIPHDVTGSSLASHRDPVIWGYLDGAMKHAQKKKSGAAGHPQLVSGSQTKQVQEISKTMQDEVPYRAQDDIKNAIEPEDGDPEGHEIPKAGRSDNGIFADNGLTSKGTDTGNSVNELNRNQGSNSFDEQALADYVRKEIERRKYYPDIAKSRGIEGTVYINFYIGQDGTPSGISVARSSGSKILDNAGMKTIGMIGKISNLHKDLRELDFVVPITYRLD